MEYPLQRAEDILRFVLQHPLKLDGSSPSQGPDDPQCHIGIRVIRQKGLINHHLKERNTGKATVMMMTTGETKSYFCVQLLQVLNLEFSSWYIMITWQKKCFITLHFILPQTLNYWPFPLLVCARYSRRLNPGKRPLTLACASVHSPPRLSGPRGAQALQEVRSQVEESVHTCPLSRGTRVRLPQKEEIKALRFRGSLWWKLGSPQA